MLSLFTDHLLDPICRGVLSLYFPLHFNHSRGDVIRTKVLSDWGLCRFLGQPQRFVDI